MTVPLRVDSDVTRCHLARDGEPQYVLAASHHAADEKSPISDG